MVALALGMVVVAVVLLSVERIPLEIRSLTIVVLLVLTGLVTAEQALASLSNETVVFIFALLSLAHGLSATGVMQLAGRRLLFIARGGSTAFVVVLLLAVCMFSSLASNTAVTAAFLPVAVASARQLRIPLSRLLMPLAFASMLGGMVTLFGTSTNLVVSAAMEELGLRPLGFFEPGRLGVLLAGVGIATTLLGVRRLIPVRDTGEGGERLVQRAYLSEALLTPGSRLVGRPLSFVTEGLGVPVQAVARGGALLPADATLELTADDHLIIAGGLDDLLKVKDLRSMGLRPDLRYAGEDDRTMRLVEVSIPPSSGLIGKSVREIRFADRHGALVLGLHRHPSLKRLHGALAAPRPIVMSGVRDVPLGAGDVLLLSGPEERIRQLARDEDLTVLGTVEHQRPRYTRAALALAIFLVTIALAATGVGSPAVVGLVGVLAMVATGCVPIHSAFRVDWRILLMIGALLSLAQAMERSGAGVFIAQQLLPLGDVLGPRGMLIAVMVVTTLLSIPMSNQAAALIMLPIGVHTAEVLGLSPRTFAIGICLAASCSFLTPLEPSAALVFGPGRYRFSDFLRVGGPLTLLMLCILAVGVPMLWPFSG